MSFNISDSLSFDPTYFKSILCLDGHLPDTAFFKQYSLPIIAADGAANTLMRMNIQPQLVIGDLDSLEKTLQEKLTILHKPDQNTCDYQKSLEYLNEQNLLPAIICGINGGALDHILNNINIFLKTNSVLYASPCIGYTLQANQTSTHTLPTGTKVSLIGIPHARVSSKGLEWELTNFEMTFPGSNSCFNCTTNEIVEWQVHEGRILVLIYFDSI